MEIKSKHHTIYRIAYKYLLELLPEGLYEAALQKYFVGDSKDFNSLTDVYEQIIRSAQNYQSMPQVLKFEERKDGIKEILCDYDFTNIISRGVEDLYLTFRKKFNVTSTDNPRNSWHKWSRSIYDAAKFMNNFSDVEDFKEFVEMFSYNLHTRTALPLLISTKISGIGFALACDCLKELGYINYPKPDIHLVDIFSGLELSEKDPISVFEAIIRMSEDCKEIDSTATPYKIDKIIWLICSGRFYLDQITIGRHKKEFLCRTRSKIGR